MGAHRAACKERCYRRARFDSHAWDFALWIERKLASGDLWLAYLELTKYVELIVIAAWNAVAGKAWAGATRVEERLPPPIRQQLERALPREVDGRELRRSLRELVALYEPARLALQTKLRQPLADELAEQVRRVIR